MRKKGTTHLCFLILFCLIFIKATITVQAQGKNIYTSPYVTISPDGGAWTVSQPLPEDAGQGNRTFWYEEGDRFKTGISSTLRSLQRGEHYYSYNRTGMIPVGEWKVEHKYARCIHNLQKYFSDFHGVDFGTKTCGQPYFSGWVPYCADCGNPVMYAYMYMSKEAAQSIQGIDTHLEYYYLCPNTRNGTNEICHHLEQGYKVPHSCSAISYNRYLVIYEKNIGLIDEEVSGYMAPSFHMFNNATEYNGEPVTPVKTLSLNSYSRTGYKFTGWNTKPDGTGTAYSDGQEIFNLCSENYDSKNLDPDQGKVVLYAQWKKVESNLVFDANGGSYSGESPVRRGYSVNYRIDGKGTVTPPQGHTVSFQTNGGSYIDPITGTQQFLRWDIQGPLHGKLINNSIYQFLGNMNDTDIAKAVYSPDPITLPAAEKPGSSFGGWYLDPELTILAGFEGDPYTPPEDTTLYAKWVELKLQSTDNYTANNGKGAVDLKWWQPDHVDKTYKLYQSADGGATYAQISSVTESITGEEGTDWTIGFERDSGGVKVQTFTVPSSGFYTITADGAQGGSCDSHAGGLGGSVTGKFYLTKGEVISFRVGGQDGANGGGTATDYGNGGGMTEVSSDMKGILLVAGGGGGATPSGDGQAGGSGTNLVASGGNGGSGMSGGGGGWLGGASGEYIVHYHNTECQNTTSNSAPARMYAEAASENNGNCWGHLKECGADWASINVRAGGDDRDEGGYGIRIGGQGSPLLDTPGNGTLSLDIFHSNWNGWNYTYGAKKIVITVISDKGAEIASYDIMSTPVVETSVEKILACNEPSDPIVIDHVKKTLSGDMFHGTITHYDGFGHEHDGDWHQARQDTKITGTLKLNIPEDVEGIYIQCQTEFYGIGDGDPLSLTTKISNIRYSSSEYICGYNDGDVISSKPAYGGSSYANESYAITQSSTAGTRSGDGCASIKSETIGLAEGQELNGVAAADTMAPYAVDQDSIVKEVAFGQVLVAFGPVKDRGTEYYFKAESYSTRTGQLMCTSNITKNLLITGLDGYLYLLDTESTTNVTLTNAMNSGSPDAERTIPVTPMPYVQYLHIAAVDKAGNVSDTVHVEISKGDPAVAWNLSTDTISIDSKPEESGHGNIYPASDDRTYYVRADGATPFVLSYMSYIHGQARDNYQIDYQIFDSRIGSGLNQRYISRLPYTVPLSSTDALDGSKFTRQTEGSVILNDAMYTGASRSSRAETLTFYQAFTIDSSFNGETVTVTPVAGATFGASVRYSDWTDDMTHAIYLIADGEPPEITGLEAFQSVALIDRNEGKIVLEISADDALCGVGDFYLVIENEDNHCTMTYTPDADGIIRVEITKDEPVFSGDFTVTASATDNVGNVNQEVWHVTEFALDAQIQRILAPHDPIFKRGESGELYVTTWGYADRIEIEFPDFLSEYNQVIEYLDDPEYRKDEKIRFMVPLDAPKNEGASYEVTVRAYKGDKELEQHPSITTIQVNGSVLDEIRTRLR